MSGFWEQFVVTYGPAALDIIIRGLILPLLAAGVALVMSKLKSDRIKRFLADVDDKVVRAVVAANQSFVDNLKKEGKFDKEAQDKIFAQVVQEITILLTDEGLELLHKYTGDGMLWLRDTILMHVRDNKLEV